MAGKGRSKGDWIAVAKGRANKVREPLANRPGACVPAVTDVGSAAYRRLLAKKSR